VIDVSNPAEMFYWLKKGDWVFRFGIRPYSLGMGSYLHKINMYILEEHRDLFVLYKHTDTCLYKVVAYIKRMDKENFDVNNLEEFVVFYNLIKKWGDKDD